MLCNKHHPVFGHGVLHALEEVAAQVRRIAVFVVSALVAAVKKVPVAIVNVIAQRPAEGDARIRDFFTLPPDFLPFFLAELHQKVVKIFVKGFGICPMKLYGVAHHQASFFTSRNIFITIKQQVQR